MLYIHAHTTCLEGITRTKELKHVHTQKRFQHYTEKAFVTVIDMQERKRMPWGRKLSQYQGEFN